MIYAAIVMDESGSMACVRESTIDAVNEQISIFKKEPQTKVTFLKFNTTVPEPVFKNVRGPKLKKITKEDYKPSGLTALRDGIAKAIQTIQTDNLEDRYLVIVFSDGWENNSKEFTVAAYKKLKKSLDDRWTFTFMGTTEDQILLAQQDYGFLAGNTSTYVNNAEGWRYASHRTYVGTQSYLHDIKSGAQSVSDFYSQTDED